MTVEHIFSKKYINTVSEFSPICRFKTVQSTYKYTNRLKMAKTIQYTLDDTFGPCLIYLERVTCPPNTDSLALNLHGATVRELFETDENNVKTVIGFHIQTLTGGAKVSASSSFTMNDIQTLIQNCHA